MRIPRHRPTSRARSLTGLLTVALVAGIGLVSAAPPAAAQEPFAAYTVFNVPSETAVRDRSIEQEIVALADAVPSGSYIRGAMYSWTSPPVASALARAAARGAVVRVVVDPRGEGGVNAQSSNEAMATLRGANLDDLVRCGNSASTSGSTACIGNHSNSIQHNKFFTFSTSGDKKRVVLVTSQNLTFSQNNRFNNAVVMHEDYDLYDQFVRYFNDLRAQRKNTNYYASANGYYRSPNTNVTTYHSPRATGDTLVSILRYVTRYESGCSVELAQLWFTNPRVAVAEELLRIARLGCQVRLVYGTMGTTVYSVLQQSGNISMKKFHDAESSNFDGRVVDVHSKYLIVNGNYNGTAGRTIVYTGSHNITGPALRNHDETLLKIEHPTVSAGFRDNFATLWSRAKCVNPSNDSCRH